MNRPTLKKHVSAQNITDITTDPAFVDGKIPPMPSKEEIIDQIFTRLKTRIEKSNHQKARSYPEGLSGDFNDRAETRAEKDLARFQDLVYNTPSGWELALVLYVVPNKPDKKHIYSEFTRNSRSFLKFIGHRNEQQLRDRGIDDDGLARMKNHGLAPVSKKGESYNMETHHKVERGGSGSFATIKAPDPNNGNRMTYLVNHFNNLVYITGERHADINFIHRLQNINGNARGGDKIFIVSLVPSHDRRKNAGFVQPRADKTPATKENIHVTYCIKQLGLSIDATIKTINDLKKNATIHRALLAAQGATDAYNDNIKQRSSCTAEKTVAGLARKERRDKKRSSLEKAFNTNARYHKAGHSTIHHILRPELRTINTLLLSVLKAISKETQTPRDKSNRAGFKKFYKSGVFKSLRGRLEKWPLPESWILEQTFIKIDKTLGVDTKPGRRGKPAQKKPRRRRRRSRNR